MGSILGSLSLSDKELSTEISFEFSKKEIFRKPFSSKIEKDEFKDIPIKEVQSISFSIEDKDEKSHGAEVIYYFKRGDIDEITVRKKFKKIFSPLDITGLVERFVENLNTILKGW